MATEKLTVQEKINEDQRTRQGENVQYAIPVNATPRPAILMSGGGRKFKFEKIFDGLETRRVSTRNSEKPK